MVLRMGVVDLEEGSFLFYLYFAIIKVSNDEPMGRIHRLGNKAVSDGGVFNIRSLIHLVTLQLLYRHTHRHTDTQSL